MPQIDNILKRTGINSRIRKKTDTFILCEKKIHFKQSLGWTQRTILGITVQTVK